MLSIFLCWLYITFVVFVIGDTIYYSLHKFLQRSEKNVGITNYLPACFMTGIVTVTIYAGFFSLFSGVGLLANIILMIAAVLLLLYHKKRIWKTLRNYKCNRYRTIFYLFLAGMILMTASGENKIYDTSHYHAQAVRWIEEYGCVKGIANVCVKVGFNSSSFLLDALFGMKDIFQQSLRPVNSWLVFALFIFSFERIIQWKKHPFHISDMLCLSSVLYILTNWKAISSLSTDLIANIGCFFCMILFLDCLERQEEQAFPYAMLCIFEVWLMTVKFSMAIILLNAALPLYYLIKYKKWSETILYSALGLLTAAPHLIRNLFISGWLFFPATILKLGDFDWAVPSATAQNEANWIYSWARIPGARFDETLYSGFLSWFPTWFKNLGIVYICAFIWFLLLFLITLTAILYHCNRNKEKKMSINGKGLFIFCTSIFATVLFWFLTAPDIRFSASLIFFTIFSFPAVTVMIVNKKWGKNFIKSGTFCMLLLFSCSTFGKIIYEAEDTWKLKNNFYMQNDYQNISMEQTEIGNITFYYPEEGDLLGYHAFPAIYQKDTNFELLGESIEDGFRPK